MKNGATHNTGMKVEGNLRLVAFTVTLLFVAAFTTTAWGQQSSSLTVYKFRDTDGDPSTIESAKKWYLSVYKDSVSPANLVAAADTSVLTIPALQAGSYVVAEADSGASWVRLNGNHTRFDTLTILSAQTVADTFINFQPNTIIVVKYQDNDGNFNTNGDRVPKSWHLEIHKNTASGPLVNSSDAGVDSIGGLGDGTYVVTESDSTGWINLGYVFNGTPTSSNADSVVVSLQAGQIDFVQLVNAPPVYSQLFRSFRADIIGVDVDNKGKIGKPVKRKADKNDFSLRLYKPGPSTMLALKFSMNVIGTYSTDAPSNGSFNAGKEVDVPISAGVNRVDVVGRGDKGRLIKATYIWDTSPKATKGTVADSSYNYNIPRLPMPNRVNALVEAYEQGAFGPSGLTVGIAHPEAPKFYAWIAAPRYTDVLKMQRGYTGFFDPDPTKAKCLSFYDNGRPMKGQLKNILPSKQYNRLLADLVALKVNIGASEAGKIPPGFGELIYNGDAGTLTYALKGKTINEIAAYCDAQITSVNDNTGRHCNDGLHILDSVLALLNQSFEGYLDTIDFAAGKLHFKGTRALADVPYLIANPNIQPKILAERNNPIVQVPTVYRLYQNYPNPFNPTTTIQFDLPDQAFVTLKVYNILGQEVTTLIDHQQIDEGTREVQFNANALASGVYFYRIVAQGMNDDGLYTTTFTTVKKMLFVK